MCWQTDIKDYRVFGIDNTEILAFLFSAKAVRCGDPMYFPLYSVALPASRLRHPSRKETQGRIFAKIDKRILGQGEIRNARGILQASSL